MGVLIVRQLMMGLVSLTLVMPVSVWHVCRCAHAESVAVTAVKSAPLRPCCAKRMAAATPRHSDQSPAQIRAKCCCSDLKWNEAVTQAPPARETESRFIHSTALAVKLPIPELQLSRSQADEFRSLEPRAAENSLQILLCRWLA